MFFTLFIDAYKLGYNCESFSIRGYLSCTISLISRLVNFIMAINNQLHLDFSRGGRLGKAKVISLFACVLFTLVLVFVLKINSSHIGIIIPSSATAGQEEMIEEVDKGRIRVATLF